MVLGNTFGIRMNGGRDRAVATRRAQLRVEALEGRRLLDGSSTASLLVNAQAYASLVSSEQVAVMGTLTQARQQVAAQEQDTLNYLHASEQRLQAVIGSGSGLANATGHTAVSAGASAKAQASASVQGQLATLKHQESVVIKTANSAEAKLSQKITATQKLFVQAEANAQQAVAAAQQGVATQVSSLQGKVAAAVSQAQQTQASVQGSVAVAVSVNAQAQAAAQTIGKVASVPLNISL